MKVNVLGSNLIKGIDAVERSVAGRPQLPVLGNVLIRASKEGLEFMATDLEVGMRMKVGAKVIEEGEVSVSARVFSELVKTMGEGTVELSKEGEGVRVVGDGADSVINGIAAGEFPELPEFGEKEDFVVDREVLMTVVERISFSASRDDVRPILSGVLWELSEKGGRLVTTDGYRLSVIEVDSWRGEGKWAVPVRAVMELVRVAGKEEGKVMVKFEKEKQQVVFKVGGVTLVSRLLAGEFPPYGQIMPTDHKTRVTMHAGELQEAVKRAVIFARDAANIIRLEVGVNGVKVMANSSQVGSSTTELLVPVDGEPLKVAFNGKYMLEYLSVVGGGEIVFESQGALKPGVFKVPDSTWTHVIMPVRVQE